MIDYVLAATGESSLHYIGHSQGTTSFFVMGSLRTEMNAKIRTMHALGKSKTNMLEQNGFSIAFWLQLRSLSCPT